MTTQLQLIHIIIIIIIIKCVQTTQDPQGFMGSLELKQKDSCSSETLVVIYQPKWCHALEKGNLQILGTYLNTT